jgi:large conductance mechanosensitive channel
MALITTPASTHEAVTPNQTRAHLGDLEASYMRERASGAPERSALVAPYRQLQAGNRLRPFRSQSDAAVAMARGWRKHPTGGDDVTLLADFKKFLFRGNVVDLAVAVVIGLAFVAVVKALVADLLTPIIALIFGKPSFQDLSFTINGSHFLYGDFINNLITFVSIAAAVYFFVVAPINHLMARRAQEDPDTKECPECTSAIPIRARRCPLCTAEIGLAAGA